MYRTVIRTLFVAAALLLTTTACDKGGDAKDAGKGAEKKAAEPEVKAEPVKTEPVPEPVESTQQPVEPEIEPPPAAEEGGEPEPAEPEPKPDAKTPEPKPPEPKEPIAAKVDGKPVFESKCKSCHGADGKGDTTIGKKLEIPSLSGTKLAKAKIVSIIESGVPDTKMKGYKDKLTADEIDAVAVYVGKL